MRRAPDRMAIVGVALIAIAGCHHRHPGTPAVAPANRGPGLELTERGLGPITVDTTVDIPTLEALFPGTSAREREDQPDVIDVWSGDHTLFYVVALTTGQPDDGVYNVQVVSPALIGPHGWRVGAPLPAIGRLDACECWGTGIEVCYQTGTHVAVAVATCGVAPTVSDLGTRPILRLIWNPRPWPETRPPNNDGGVMPAE